MGRKRKLKDAEVQKQFQKKPLTMSDLDSFPEAIQETRGNHHSNAYFPSMKAAAFTLKLPIEILQDARAKDCPAFRTGGFVHRQQLIDWLAEQTANGEGAEIPDDPDNFTDTYDIPDEAGGVGITLKSLQMAERRLKRKLDLISASTKIHVVIKAKLEKEALEAWLKVVGQLLKYDLAVDMAKRESGELIPIVDAIAGVHALLAWHSISMSDALRNAIPDCEGCNKYEIAALLDPALRSSIYRNFKLAVENNKIPEWMGKTVEDYTRAEKPLVKTVFADPFF